MSFIFYEIFFDIWWVVRGKMSVLKGFSWFKMGFYIQDRLIMELFVFENDGIQKCSFCV